MISKFKSFSQNPRYPVRQSLCTESKNKGGSNNKKAQKRNELPTFASKK